MQILKLSSILTAGFLFLNVLGAPPPGGIEFQTPSNALETSVITSSIIHEINFTEERNSFTSRITPTAATASTSPTGTSTDTSIQTGACSTPQASAETISVSQSKPTNAVKVPGNFVGFGFETAFINDYCVGTFSENLVNSVAKRLGETVIIRIGGTSGDHVLIDPNQTKKKVCIDGDCPIGSSASYILGPSYFEGFKRFQNQKWTIQAPLGEAVNYTSSLEYISWAYSAAGAERVDAIAIGNEPDTYGDDYTLDDYIKGAIKLERKIAKKLGLGNEPIFEILDTASGEPTGNFSVSTAFVDGIDQIPRTKYVAQHWYQSPIDLTNYGPTELQTYIMNHSAITSMYEQGYTSTLDYIATNQPDVDYIISESGSALAGPPKDYQDAFGAALWFLDFSLYSMALGVKRVDASHRPASPHSFWVPDKSANSASLGDSQNTGPQVRGPYYAIPMIADFLGKDSGAVVGLLWDDTKTAYALYDNTSGALSKVALVNLEYWSADTGGVRGSTTFEVPVSKSKRTVTVKRLRAEDGAHAAGYDVHGEDGIITWAGETWSYKLNNGNGSHVDGVEQQEIVEVCNGVASIVVPDSEAVIVYVS